MGEMKRTKNLVGTSKMGLVDNIKVGLKERGCRRCELDSGGSGHGSVADL
jgi:hypothetical protein